MKHILEKHAPFLVIIILLVIGLIYFTVFRAPAQEELTFVEAGEDLPTNCVPPGETLTGDQVHCVRRAAGAILGEDALNASEEDGDFGKSLCISSLGKVITCGGETDETTNIGSGTAAEAPVGTVVSVRANPSAPTAPVIYAESETDSAINVEINSVNSTPTDTTKLELQADSTSGESFFRHYVGGIEKAKLKLDENGVFRFGNSISIDGYSTNREISSDSVLLVDSALGSELTIQGGADLVLRAGGPVGPGFEVATLSGTNGYMGIGWPTPEAPLHISDFMKLEPRSSAPFSPVAGFVYVRDDIPDLFCFYDGTAWQELTAGSDALCN